MARRKRNAARKALEAVAGPWASLTKQEREWEIQKMLCGLRHLAKDEGLIFAKMDAGAARHHLQDVCTADGCRAETVYSGWDRRHDDNKAEGRPIGRQWNSEGADYSLGIKVWRGNRKD